RRRLRAHDPGCSRGASGSPLETAGRAWVGWSGGRASAEPLLSPSSVRGASAGGMTVVGASAAGSAGAGAGAAGGGGLPASAPDTGVGAISADGAPSGTDGAVVGAAVAGPPTSPMASGPLNCVPHCGQNRASLPCSAPQRGQA